MYAMLTKLLSSIRPVDPDKKLHRRQLFTLFLSVMPLLAAGRKELPAAGNSSVHPKSYGYGKGAYGG